MRKTGARIKLIADGDVSAVIATTIEDSEVDLYLGAGGSLASINRLETTRRQDGQSGDISRYSKQRNSQSCWTQKLLYEDCAHQATFQLAPNLTLGAQHVLEINSVLHRP